MEGGGYVSRPRASRGMSGPEGWVLRSLMREERALAVMFCWAYLRLRSSMSGGDSALIYDRSSPAGIRTSSNESPFWPLRTSQQGVDTARSSADI
jgi:hypothetical protein